MGLAGLIDVERYRADPTFRSYVDVVPVRPARAAAAARSAPVLKGVWPGIGADDRVMLWAGGVWRWLDAITPIRAVERLRAEGRRVHLVFLGTGRPQLKGANIPTSAGRGDRASRAERGLEGVVRALQPRLGPLRRARGATCSSPTSACARTTTTSRRASPSAPGCSTTSGPGCRRWCSGGDAIGDLVDRRGLGRAVAPGDARGLRRGVRRAARRPRRPTTAGRGRVRELAPSLRWSEVARPLVRFCREQAHAPGAPAGPRRARARDLRAVPRHPGRPARPRRPAARSPGACRTTWRALLRHRT